jgi:hypothetical protein
MMLSLNEIETTILKAARGAGMEWGLAEEAAKAARWLARQSLAFEAAFLAVLEARPWRTEIALERGALRPRQAGEWLCPVRAGACLSDLEPDPAKWAPVPGEDLAPGAVLHDILPLRIERVLQPLLLLPFAARLATPVEVAWNGIRLRLRGARLAQTSGDRHASFGDRADRVELTASGAMDAPARAEDPPGGIEVDGAIWPKLQAFEARTYVPASLRSRLSGAGAAASDND